jgi:hypothetical protein
VTLGQPEERFWSSTPERIFRFAGQYQRSEARRDYRAGLLASILVNVNRDRKGGGRPAKPADFFPTLEASREMPQAEIRARFLTAARAAQGAHRRAHGRRTDSSLDRGDH